MRNKRFRQRWRHYCVRVVSSKKEQRIKWGVSYSVWDGEELLEASIRSIRPVVDYVQVCWQNLSWIGTPASQDLVPLLKRLKKEGLIDELVEFKPDIKDKPWHNELRKRNLGLEYAKKAGVNYFMTMDSDEFYLPDQLQKAKILMLERNITHLYCPLKTYTDSPCHQVLENGYFVQLFAKIHWFSKLGNNLHVPCLVDPTRKNSHYPFAKYYVMDGMCMHHMSTIRKNIALKFKNSSYQKIQKRGEYFKDVTIVIVPDQFGLLALINNWKRKK